jgi:hypothetical protein
MDNPRRCTSVPGATRLWARTGWLGALLLLNALAVAGLALAVRGSSHAPVILDTERIERAIETTSLAQRGADARVSCPAGTPQRSGLVFSCTALVGRSQTRLVATQLDGSGRVRFEAR